MRRTMRAVALGAAITVIPTVAGADPPPNEHNCVGATDSSFAGPGFGGVVSGIARSGPGAIADSLEAFANCGQTGPG